MLRHFVVRFGARWAVTALGLWIAAALLGPDRLSVGDSWKTVLGAGFFLALVNMSVRPLLIILSFPAIILSLGLFMLLINGLLILLVSKIYDPLFVKDLWVAMLAGLIVGFINFAITKIIEDT
jgi:putative membrane protein